ERSMPPWRWRTPPRNAHCKARSWQRGSAPCVRRGSLPGNRLRPYRTPHPHTKSRHKMISIKRLQNVYVVARDVPAASAFYERMFGLPVKFSDGNRWMQFDVHGSGFALASLDEGVLDQAGAVPVFEV